MEKLQKDVDWLGEWAVENAMKINPSKSKAIRFTRVRVKDPLNYSLLGTVHALVHKHIGLYIGIRWFLFWTVLLLFKSNSYTKVINF